MKIKLNDRVKIISLTPSRCLQFKTFNISCNGMYSCKYFGLQGKVIKIFPSLTNSKILVQFSCGKEVIGICSGFGEKDLELIKPKTIKEIYKELKKPYK